MRSLYNLLLLLCIMFFCSLNVKGEEMQRTFEVINASDGLADNSAQTIISLPDGRMVMTTIGYINIYDGIKFTHINTDKGDFYTLPNYTGNYHLYLDNVNRLWIKNKQTVTCVDLLTEQCIANIQDIFRSEGVSTTVVDVFIDSDGNLWMMSEGRFYGSGKEHSIPVADAKQLQDMDVVGDSIFLFYSTGEVVCHEISTGREIYHLSSYDVNQIVNYDRTSVLKRCGDDFIQIRNGVKGAILMHLDTQNRKWHLIKTLEHKLNNIAEHNGLLYIPSAYGYWTYNLLTSEMLHYEHLALVDGRILDTDINVIAFDYQGGMWLGTETRGLLYSRPIASPFEAVPWYSVNRRAEHYALMMDTVSLPDLTAYDQNTNCVCTDSRNWIWIGTQTGLELRRTEAEDPIYITKKDGLLNEVIHSIIEDNNHNIWLSTSHGVACVIVADDTIKLVNSYFECDNIPSETFRNNRAVKTDDGIIAMQAIDYVLVFDPDSFRTHSDQMYNVRPMLINVAVNGRELSAGTTIDDRMMLDKSVSNMRYFKFAHDQNTVVLTFSGLNYFRPLQTFYRIRISGLYDEWRQLSYYDSDGLVNDIGVLRLPLIGLLSGTYKIEVQTSMRPDEWKEEPMVITVEIEKPWWEADGFYILFIFVLSLLIVINVIYYNRNYRLSMRRNNEEKDVLRRLRSYLMRCNDLAHEVFAPDDEEIKGISTNKVDLDSAFVEMMLNISPLLNNEKVTVRDLSAKSCIDINAFYSLVNVNVYKNPRMLARAMRLEYARKMLKETDFTIDEIAEECSFSTPSYFISCFYQHYHITPKDYRD